MSIGGDVVLTRADRQRYKIPTYNLTTGQPLPDVKGGGNLAVNFGNSAFHSLFPEIVYLHNHGFQAVATVSFRLIPLLHDTRKL